MSVLLYYFRCNFGKYINANCMYLFDWRTFSKLRASKGKNI